MSEHAHLETGRGARRAADDRLRLELAEALLAETEPASCARRALTWARESAGSAAGLCAVVDLDETHLEGIAGIGIPHEEVAGFRVDLEERTHPLVVVLESREPILFEAPDDRSRRQPPETPLGPVSVAAVPLGDDGASLGLLLLSDEGGALAHDDLQWLGRTLGSRLCALWYRRARREERRYRREAAWLAGAIEAVTDPILLTDAEGRTLVANSGAEELLSADESAGTGRRRAVALNNMMFSARLFTNAEEGKASRRELLLVDPVEGQDLLFELLTTPFPLDGGETGIVSILRDVTDLSRATSEIEENYRRVREAEAETRAERDRLDLILDSVLDPILVTDPSGNIVRMNPPAERMFTVDPEKTAVDAERRVRANDAVFTSLAFNVYAGRSRRWRKELTLTDPHTGEQIPFEAIAAKTRAKSGEEAAVVTILHDQSEAVERARLYEQVKRHSEELQVKIREATQELAEQNELLRRQALELENASAMKSQFLANVSHELRTPLHAVVGYTSLLLAGVSGELDPKQREKLERVDANANHLLSIIDDVLDLTKIESGKMRVEPVAFTLEDLFEEVRREAESLIEASDLLVTFTVDPDVPDLYSDRKKIKQILINLLSNALKFTPAGSVELEASMLGTTDRVAIAVADTGIGIPPEKQTTIFEAFGQSESFFTKGQSGTGLGLSICRRLATVLGGDITLESAPGDGSTFTLVLPRTVDRD